MGREKALLPLGSATVIDLVILAARPLSSDCRLIANDAARFAHLGLPMHADLRPGAGPLGGLHTALTVAAAPAVLLLACDLPFLTAEFLGFVVEQLSGWQAVVPRSADGLENLCAVYARSCLPAVERALDRGERRMIAFHGDVALRVLEPREWGPFDPQGRLFANLNTPEDYRRALAQVGQAAGQSR